jgi:hypothetical protein
MAKTKKIEPETEFTDVAGVPLKIGMLVAANHSESADLTIFKITKFSPKKVTMEEAFPKYDWKRGCVRYPHQLCAIDEKYGLLLLLSSGKKEE